MTLIKQFIGWAHHRHTFGGRYMTWHSKADYEVCGDVWCRLAVWLEATFNPYAAWQDASDISEVLFDDDIADIDTGWPEL